MPREVGFLDAEGERLKRGERRVKSREVQGINVLVLGRNQDWPDSVANCKLAPPAATITGAPQRTLTAVPLLLFWPHRGHCSPQFQGLCRAG